MFYGTIYNFFKRCGIVFEYNCIVYVSDEKVLY